MDHALDTPGNHTCHPVAMEKQGSAQQDSSEVGRVMGGPVEGLGLRAGKTNVT